MKPTLHKFLSFGKLHLTLTGIFLYLLLAVYWIPNEPIMEHAALSAALLSEASQSNYLLTEVPPTGNESALLSAIGQNPEYSTLWNVLSVQDTGYRWNGIQILLRPLLYFFHIGQIRYLCMLLFFLLLFAAAYQIARKFSFAHGFFFLITFLWADLIPVSYSIPDACCFFILFLAVLLLTGKKDCFWKEPQKPSFIFYGIGAVTAVMDSMTIPVITLSIPLTIFFLSIRRQSPDAPPRSLWKQMFFPGILWILGYLLMICTKWLLTVIATGKNFFPDYIHQIAEECIGSVISPASIRQMYLDNLKAYISRAGFGMTALLIALATAALAYLLLFAAGHRPWRDCAAFLPLLPVSLLPYLFYLILPGHALLHTGITFRAQAACFYPVLLFFYSLLDTERIRQRLNTAMELLRRD